MMSGIACHQPRPDWSERPYGDSAVEITYLGRWEVSDTGTTGRPAREPTSGRPRPIPAASAVSDAAGDAPGDGGATQRDGQESPAPTLRPGSLIGRPPRTVHPAARARHGRRAPGPGRAPGRVSRILVDRVAEPDPDRGDVEGPLEDELALVGAQATARNALSLLNARSTVAVILLAAAQSGSPGSSTPCQRAAGRVGSGVDRARSGRSATCPSAVRRPPSRGAVRGGHPRQRPTPRVAQQVNLGAPPATGGSQRLSISPLRPLGRRIPAVRPSPLCQPRSRAGPTARAPTPDGGLTPARRPVAGRRAAAPAFPRGCLGAERGGHQRRVGAREPRSHPPRSSTPPLRPCRI